MCQKQVQVPTIFQENQLFSQKDATHQTHKGSMRNEKHEKNDTNLCFVDAADSESQDHANGRASRVQSQACLSYAETKPALASANTLQAIAERCAAVCLESEMMWELRRCDPICHQRPWSRQGGKAAPCRIFLCGDVLLQIVARLRHAVFCHDFMFPFFLQAFRRLYKNVRLCYSTPSPMSTQATYNILFSPLIGTSPNLGEELFGGSIPFY